VCWWARPQDIGTLLGLVGPPLAGMGQAKAAAEAAIAQSGQALAEVRATLASLAPPCGLRAVY
jgi:hypothetical protein